MGTEAERDEETIQVDMVRVAKEIEANIAQVMKSFLEQNLGEVGKRWEAPESAAVSQQIKETYEKELDRQVTNAVNVYCYDTQLERERNPSEREAFEKNVRDSLKKDLIDLEGAWLKGLKEDEKAIATFRRTGDLKCLSEMGSFSDNSKKKAEKAIQFRAKKSTSIASKIPNPFRRPSPASKEAQAMLAACGSLENRNSPISKALVVANDTEDDDGVSGGLHAGVALLLNGIANYSKSAIPAIDITPEMLDVALRAFSAGCDPNPGLTIETIKNIKTFSDPAKAQLFSLILSLPSCAEYFLADEQCRQYLSAMGATGDILSVMLTGINDDHISTLSRLRGFERCLTARPDLLHANHGAMSYDHGKQDGREGRLLDMMIDQHQPPGRSTLGSIQFLIEKGADCRPEYFTKLQEYVNDPAQQGHWFKEYFEKEGKDRLEKNGRMQALMEQSEFTMLLMGMNQAKTYGIQELTPTILGALLAERASKHRSEQAWTIDTIAKWQPPKEINPVDKESILGFITAPKCVEFFLTKHKKSFTDGQLKHAFERLASLPSNEALESMKLMAAHCPEALTAETLREALNTAVKEHYPPKRDGLDKIRWLIEEKGARLQGHEQDEPFHKSFLEELTKLKENGVSGMDGQEVLRKLTANPQAAEAGLPGFASLHAAANPQNTGATPAGFKPIEALIATSAENESGGMRAETSSKSPHPYYTIREQAKAAAKVVLKERLSNCDYKDSELSAALADVTPKKHRLEPKALYRKRVTNLQNKLEYLTDTLPAPVWKAYEQKYEELEKALPENLRGQDPYPRRQETTFLSELLKELETETKNSRFVKLKQVAEEKFRSFKDSVAKLPAGAEKAVETIRARMPGVGKKSDPKAAAQSAAQHQVNDVTPGRN